MSGEKWICAWGLIVALGISLNVATAVAAPPVETVLAAASDKNTDKTVKPSPDGDADKSKNKDADKNKDKDHPKQPDEYVPEK